MSEGDSKPVDDDDGDDVSIAIPSDDVDHRIDHKLEVRDRNLELRDHKLEIPGEDENLNDENNQNQNDENNQNLDENNDQNQNQEDVAYSITRNWQRRCDVGENYLERSMEWMSNYPTSTTSSSSNPSIPSITPSELRFHKDHPIFKMFLAFHQQLEEYKALHDDDNSTTDEGEMRTFQTSLRNELETLQNEMQTFQKERQAAEGEIQILQRQEREKSIELQHIEKKIKDIEEKTKAKQKNIDDKQNQIIFISNYIKARIDDKRVIITKELAEVYKEHVLVRNHLDSVKQRGNENLSTVTTNKSGGSSMTNDSRIDISKVPSPSKLLILGNPKANNSLEEELIRHVGVEHWEKLEKFQKFVASLVKEAPAYDKQKVRQCAERLDTTLQTISNWDPDSNEEIVFKKLVRPSFTIPNENDVDNLILRAIILRMMRIVDVSLRTLGTEQFVPDPATSREATEATKPVTAPGTSAGRRVDLEARKTTREHLSSLFPAMLGRVIEIKAVSENDSKLMKRLWQAENQIIGHLGRQASFSFDFGGVGENCDVYGISLSIWSVSVAKLELRDVGTAKVRVDTKRTERLRLLGNDYKLPSPDVENLLANGHHNAFVVLAGALMATCKPHGQDALMGQQELPQLVEVMKGGDSQQLKVEQLLGSGAFSNVLKLKEKGQFLKIPRAEVMIESLEFEAKVLSEINSDTTRVDIPQLVNDDGQLSILKFFNNHEEGGDFSGLKLKGIVGETLLTAALHRSCDHRTLEVMVRKVFEALEYAHNKGYVHLDIRPVNIIVDCQQNNVMVSDWGVASKLGEEIGFRGCFPYAHDNWFIVQQEGGKSPKKQTPTVDFDFASLLYTWVHVVVVAAAAEKTKKEVSWSDEFQRGIEYVDGTALEKRRDACKEALLLLHGAGGAETYYYNYWNERLIKAAGLLLEQQERTPSRCCWWC